jgi:hypothetical protein
MLNKTGTKVRWKGDKRWAELRNETTQQNGETRMDVGRNGAMEQCDGTMKRNIL